MDEFPFEYSLIKLWYDDFNVQSEAMWHFFYLLKISAVMVGSNIGIFNLVWFLFSSAFSKVIIVVKGCSATVKFDLWGCRTRASKPLQEVDQFLFTHSWRNLKDKITKKRLLLSFTVRWTTIGPLFIFRTEVFNNDHAFVALKPRRWIQIVSGRLMKYLKSIVNFNNKSFSICSRSPETLKLTHSKPSRKGRNIKEKSNPRPK